MGQVVQFARMAKLENPPNRIREQREARVPKMTLAAMATRLGTSPAQIARFETGERPVTRDWLRRIADVLDTDIGQLLNPEDNPASLSPEERRVIDAMRYGEPHVAKTIASVADSLVSFTGQGERNIG